MGRVRIAAVLLIATMAFTSVPVTIAETPANDAFNRTWMRTDLPVADGEASRTWMWGPEAFTGATSEPYVEAPGGERSVQYFDKARMEDNSHRAGGPPWDVTNGLLVVELITGQMQEGDSEFEGRSPAQVNVAGDSDDPTGPTYATFGAVLDAAPASSGTTITQRINRDGQVTDDPALAGQNITVSVVDDVTNHAIAAPFWDFMGSSGVIYEDGEFRTDALFENRYFATGRPVTEPYWANVKVANTYRDVLMQCFERRCLTFTPDNPEGWQVEAGNVGQHYHAWRYDNGGGGEPIDGGTDTPAADLAERLYAASSDEARYDILIDIMDYLNVGVYDADGQAILGGAERGWEDFYLYEFEIQGLAAAFGRGQHHSVADIAVAMENAGWVDEETTIDPAILAMAIPAGINAALNDQDALDSRSALLIYELGLRSQYAVDLSQSFTWSDVRLDVVQHFVLLAELLVSAVEDQLPADETLSSNLVEESAGVVKPAVERASQQSICTDKPQHEKDAWGWKKIMLEVLNVLPPGVMLAGTGLDGLHGAALAFSIRVTELDQRVERHYGHGGPGDAAQFRIKVEMLDEYADIVMNCGWLVGASFPEQGPIEDVSVNWSWENLSDHGELECGTVCGGIGSTGAIALEATGPDGIATLNFTPNAENPYPCEGCWEVEETGIVTGIALYQSRFTNLLGANVQWAVPKSGATRWFVRWHETPGYELTLTETYVLSEEYHSPSDQHHIYQSESGVIEYELFLDPNQLNEHGSVIPTTSASGSGQLTFLNFGTSTGREVITNDCDIPWEGSWDGDASVRLAMDGSTVDPMTVHVGFVEPPLHALSDPGPDCMVPSIHGSGQFIEIDLTQLGTQQIVRSEPPGICNLDDWECEFTATWSVTVEAMRPE